MKNNYDENNIFYKIINGESKCKKVYEDNHVLAFHDLYPVAPVHILVIPKEKFTSFHDFIKNSTHVEHFFTSVRKIAHEQQLSENGYRIVTNHGQDSGQIVPHFHIHLIGGKKLGQIA